MGDGRAKVVRRSVFDWGEVPEPLIRKLLAAAYLDAKPPQRDEAAKATKLRGPSTVAAAEHALGRLGNGSLTPGMARVLLDGWIRPRQSNAAISNEELAALCIGVRELVSNRHAPAVFDNRTHQVRFLQQRRMTSRIREEIRKSFRRDHRRTRIYEQGSPRSERPQSLYHLAGAAAPSGLDLYEHQKAARAKLGSLLRSKGPRAPRGLIVLPTGSGKTATLVDWAIDAVLDKGHRILWLAHQRELLDQAAKTFEQQALSRPVSFAKRARVIYGGASPPSVLVESDLDVALATVNSFVRNFETRARGLRAFLQTPTLVVIDEAHHGASPTYTRVLDELEKIHREGEGELLGVVGLTATPWPSGRGARKRLSERFGKPIIKRSTEELVERRILARPVVHVVATEEILSLTERQRKRATRGDLDPEVLRQLDNDRRNRLILGVFEAGSESYGKTLLFATNIHHAEVLRDLFNEASLPARVIHSGRSSDPRRESIEWFKNTNEPSPVLISIGMLAEGVDLPQARTVLLARPTASRILLRQMIGRALRGPRAGGDPEAFIVYLRDTWRNFADVLEPGDALVVEPLETPSNTNSNRRIEQLPPILNVEGTLIPTDVVAEIDREYRTLELPEWRIHQTELIGYYELGDRKVAVLNHQRAGFEHLVREVAARENLKGTPIYAAFDDAPDPIPTRRTLKEFIEYLKEEREAPEFVPIVDGFTARDVVDRIRRLDLRQSEEIDLITSAWNSSLARKRYPSFAAWEQAIREEKSVVRRTCPQPRPSAEPSHRRPLRRSTRDLDPIVSNVKAFIRREFGTRFDQRLESTPTPEWTKQVVASYYGIWTLRRHGRNAGAKTIKINRLLSAPRGAIDDATIGYVIYHEVLHHLFPLQGHDSDFCQAEALWPDADHHAMILDTLSDTYDTDPAAYHRK